MADTPPLSSRLSRRERQVMEIVYAHAGTPAKGASANDVMRDLPDPPTRTSIRTVLRILEQKGHVTHTVQGREFVYRPVVPRGQVGKSALQSVLRAFFGDSLSNALAAYLADPKTRLTHAEARELKGLIDEAKKRGE